MNRRLLLLSVVAAALAAAPGTAAASEIDVAELLSDPERHGGSEITVTGELIGDYGHRDGVVWVQLNGDAYARAPLLAGGELSGGNLGIAARIPADLFDADRFGEPGGYRRRGPVVALTGVWRHHDADRGGESYLDVSAVTAVSPEQSLGEGAAWVPLSIGVLLLGSAGALWWRDALRRRGAS